jgi:hypothetical protein
MLVLGVGVGWYGRDMLIERAGTPTTFARSAAFAHTLYAADARRPVEVWAAEEKSLVTWLTKRLGFKVYAPDLNGLGYSLVGGRLVAGNEFPTALFMYENVDKERLSLQVRKQSARVPTRTAPAGDTAFRYSVENGVGVLLIDDDRGYGDLRQTRPRPASQGRAGRLRPIGCARILRHEIASPAAQRICAVGFGSCSEFPPASATPSTTSTRRRSSSTSMRSSATSI